MFRRKTRPRSQMGALHDSSTLARADQLRMVSVPSNTACAVAFPDGFRRGKPAEVSDDHLGAVFWELTPRGSGLLEVITSQPPQTPELNSAR